MTRKAKDILRTLANHKGTNRPMAWLRDAQVYKTCPHHIQKQVTTYITAGKEFSRLASVQRAIANGERGEVQPLPNWLKWVNRPFILAYVGNDPDKQGTEYVRLYPASFSNLPAPKVQWYLDSKPVDKATVLPFLKASETAKENEDYICFQVKVESVIIIRD